MNKTLETNSWRMDKRLNISMLMAMISSLAVAISLVLGLNTRVGLAEEKLNKVEQRVEEMRDTFIKVERIEERVLGLRALLLEIKEELKTLRRR